MKKPTTSDQLKLVFQYVLESDPADWKRLSKSKNEEGQWVRAFENKKSGETVTVTEMDDGYFNVKGKGVEANISLPEQFRKSAAPEISVPVVDQIMDILLEGEKDVPQELLKKADPAELAKRFTFTVIDEPDMGGVMAIVTPKGRDDEDSKKSCDVMKFLFPKAEYIDDCVMGMWQIDESHSRAELGAELAKAGFEWDAGNKSEVLAVQANPVPKNKPKL